MFGYIRICKPELKIKEYETYRGFYCNLCRRLGKRYGFPARLLLTYDMTFYTVFLYAVQDKCCAFQSCRCPVNPAKKCLCCDGAEPFFDLAADISVVLAYYKLLDSIADGGFFKKMLCSLARPYLSHLRRRAEKKAPELCRRAKKYAYMQFQAEHSPLASIDSSAAPTAEFTAFAALLAVPEEQRNSVSRFAYAIGRYIYLADALDDLKKDIKRKQFNPFLRAYAIREDTLSEEFSRCRESLELTAAVIQEQYRQLSVITYSPILDNIVFLGLPNAIDEISKKYQGETV